VRESVKARTRLRLVADGAGRHRSYGRVMAPIIVVGIEDSFRAQDAVALAGDLARAAAAEVLAVSAFCFDDRPSQHYNLALRDPLRDDAEETLEQLCEPLNDLPVRRLAVADPSPGRALIRAAETADAALIVVGSSHGDFTGRVTPGSTGRRLLKDAPCPVALAPQGHRMRPHLSWGRVTVGSDGSDEVVAAAATVAEATARELRVVRIFEPSRGFLRVMPDARDAEEEQLDRAVARVPGAEARFVEGDPATELARESEVADLLVVGSRADGPAGRVALGEVGERLLRGAACPVLIVPNGEVGPLRRLFAGCGKVLIESAG
jgi:nucleotide-binding universal stress UspA family protein